MNTHRRPHPRSRAVVVAVVIGFVVASCSSGGGEAQPAASTSTSASGSPTASASAAPTNKSTACDIVSDDVVTAVLGVKIVRREGKVTKQGSATGATCIKGLARSNDLSGFTFVSAAVFDDGGQGTALLDQAVSEMSAKSVPGLGDRAVFASALGTLFVIKGAKVVTVQVTKAGKPGTLKECTSLANDMLGRL